MPRLRDTEFLTLLRADPIWSIVLGSMEPHLKRSTDQRKRVWRRVVRQTNYLKVVLLKEIGILIQREDVCKTGNSLDYIKKPLYSIVHVALRVRTRIVHSFVNQEMLIK